MSVYFGRRLLFGPAAQSEWQMFFLGAAFMLIELQMISRLSLLYGCTWLTSALVIALALVVVLVANLAVIRLGERLSPRIKLLYALLGLSLLVSYLLPAEALSALDAGGLPLGYALITTVAFVPLALASSIFSIAFARTAVPSRALAFNMYGAVAGALLEYLSNYTGISALLIVAGALYALSYLAMQAKAGRAPTPSG